jgi:ribosomal protein L31
MKANIHPVYNQVSATCVCGNTFNTGSTKKEIRTEICSACHPFFTGTQKIVDTEGRVERFMKKYNLNAQGKQKA